MRINQCSGQRLGRALRCAVASLALLASGPAMAAKIGVAASIAAEVTGSLGSQSNRLSVGSEIFENQRIQTGAGANAQLLFLDQTTFTIGPKADVTVDRFIYDPRRQTGSVVLETSRGAFRFISGAQGAENYRIKTPVATIGVRGSMLYGVGTPNYFIFYVGEGHGWVSPNAGKMIDNIPAGRAVIIFADGRIVMTKFDVGDLDLNRLQELLPLFEDLPDNLRDLIEQTLPEFCECD